MGAVYKREFKTYFTSPLGFAILAVMMLFSGIYYSMLVSKGYADMTYVFSTMQTIFYFVVPIITMRLISEEKNKKTDQLLLTSPVSIFSMVMGKFFAAMSFLAIYVVAMTIYNFIFLLFGASPDFLIFIGNIVAFFLLTGSLVAIGIFISALTESQVVAAVGSFAFSFFMLMLSTIASYINIGFITSVADWISFSDRYYKFTDGVFDVSNMLFFVSIIAIFLFLTVRVIDRKRWA